MKKIHLFLVLSMFGCMGSSLLGMKQPQIDSQALHAIKQQFIQARKNYKSNKTTETERLYLDAWRLVSNAIAEQEKIDALYDAIQKNDSRKIITLITNDDVNFNAKSMVDALQGSTPLHYAALLGHLDAVKTLIDYGANMHIKDDDGRTSSDYAAAAEKTDVVLFFSEQLLNK